MIQAVFTNMSRFTRNVRRADDPAITKACFEMLLELFGRTLKLDLGAHDGTELVIEDVC